MQELTVRHFQFIFQSLSSMQGNHNICRFQSYPIRCGCIVNNVEPCTSQHSQKTPVVGVIASTQADELASLGVHINKAVAGPKY